MNQYQLEVDSINQVVAEFNKYLTEFWQIPKIDPLSDIGKRSIVKILHGRWDDFLFPKSSSPGVYFIFGNHRELKTRKCVYIGKASLSSSIGLRLYSHLHPNKLSEHFTMNYGKDIYILNYIASIDMEKIPFMAPALEEYLISSLSGKINLLNVAGNSAGGEQ